MPSIGVVEQYWTGVASQLQVEAEVFSRLVGHNGEMGRANEIALAQLVTRLVPASFGVGTGVVIDRDGGRSKQCDLIIYEQASQPQLLAQSTQLLFPIETVRMVIEVKTTVTSAAVEDAAEKAKSVRNLRSSREGGPPAFGLFGYQASGAPSARALEINELPDDSRPDLVCVLVPGLATSLEDPSRVGMVPLHATNEAGERVSRAWIPQEGTDTWVVRGATRYPVSRFNTAALRHIFEPGRALLIFAKLALDQLDLRSESESSWLGEYLPEIAREVELPQS
jgi:hypothetical protein